MKRAGIYARYSSENQRESSLDDQERRCREEAARAGYEVVNVWKDAALSGALSEEQRPGLQQMLAAAKRRAFDVLLVADASRLSRDASDALRLLQRLDYWEIGFVAISDGINTTTNGKTSRLLFGIKAAMSEDYRRSLAEHIRGGMEGRARQGLSLGGLPYGYVSHPITDARGQVVGVQRVVHPAEAAIVKRIFEEYAGGRSVREIVSRLNQDAIPSPAARWKKKPALQSWSVTTLRGHQTYGKGVLHNPLYRGVATWNRSEWRTDPDTGKDTYRLRPQSEWITVEAPDLRIVSDDLWTRVQVRSQRKPPVAVGVSGRFRHYLLSGFVTCAVCGGAYVVKTKYSYRCAAHHARGAAVCANDRSASRKPLERVVLAGLRDHLFSPDNLAAIVADVRARLEDRQRRETDREAQETRSRTLRQIETEIDHLKAAVLRGKATDTLLDMLAQKTNERDTLRSQAPSSAMGEALEALLARLPDAVAATLDTLTHRWADGDVTEGKRLLAALGTQVRLKPTKTGLDATISGDLERVLRLAAPRGSTFDRAANPSAPATPERYHSRPLPHSAKRAGALPSIIAG